MSGEETMQTDSQLMKIKSAIFEFHRKSKVELVNFIAFIIECRYEETICPQSAEHDRQSCAKITVPVRPSPDRKDNVDGQRAHDSRIPLQPA